MKDRNILLGVTGGIAAFKAAALASKLSQAGANVKVIMTEGAREFITPLTFQVVTRERVYVDTFLEEEVDKVAHIDVADWADDVLIAPATANFIGKYANGIADDMLTTTLLATKAPVYIAPATNVNMYEHPAVVQNILTLESRGVGFIEPGSGHLACGWVGKGRMAEPEDIFAMMSKVQRPTMPYLKGKKVLISAGPTREIIDPVRFLSNRSSGKTGFALAEAAQAQGAEVTLVSGPVQLPTPPGVERIDVTSAKDMLEVIEPLFAKMDLVIKTAAVADYTPAETYAHKVKKSDGDLTINMTRTTDILGELGRLKEQQVLVGFAAETDQLNAYAEAKISEKNLDMIVANDVNEAGIGFASDDNQITIIRRDRDMKTYEKQSKEDLAYLLLEEIEPLFEGVDERVRENHR
ncbi:bifunctional phosphopantothenoylcysteine decarboxylase/phosphopantothenate--cysteine ligase CoaBC [Natribacillus halophilus]|uniref:Coenzyme A biosynthesis bifunctional protein CoaBC n=1 Tax=Natribacillus halophilus TaxID=549003 RepID=A0A1G8MHA0_9BACI|nr:bifunctional phosphopantothenoylcysteine decarboxylase/phosphopantothenate--cysteine ligase CoaBC [Natribacillus halophilus]SDI67398.1 phosphopantothenoylcysteine decarboxylase / phosphopantothenate--cysteine ligase [Natribacillus halophilus]